MGIKNYSILLTFIMCLIIPGIMAAEKQKYKVLYSEGNFEIRFYPPSTTASYTVDGNYDTGRNKAFMKLYDYIVG
ncbi:MAG: heme-binding protein, partial [Bacteroidota bacterium]|nr:heme-binding protein [Bacteroidota bacterium]